MSVSLSSSLPVGSILAGERPDERVPNGLALDHASPLQLTEDFSPQWFYRDAKLMEIGEGTSEIQHAILGDELGL